MCFIRLICPWVMHKHTRAQMLQYNHGLLHTRPDPGLPQPHALAIVCDLDEYLVLPKEADVVQVRKHTQDTTLLLQS